MRFFTSSFIGKLIIGARPQTLIASVCPVLIGTVIALDTHTFHLPPFLAILFFALCIQIATNFANDYFDFLKGVDTKERKGPHSTLLSGLLTLRAVRGATILSLILAGVLGLYLIQIGGWLIGVLIILAIFIAYLYTGGPYPIGYIGLGDVCVLICFGPLATAGTTYLQTNILSPIAIIAGLAPGLFSTALLSINNLRDMEQDRKALKKTLPIRFGVLFSKWESTLCLILPCLIPLYLVKLTSAHFMSLISIGYIVFTISPIYALFKGEKMDPLFSKIGKIFTLYSVLFTLGWMFS